MKKSPIVVPQKEYKNDQKTMQYCSIELYPKTTSYNFEKVKSKIIKYCVENNCQYVSMLHDRDYYRKDTFNYKYELIGRAGQKKEVHEHFLIAFRNRVDLNGFANNIGIEERWIKILKHDYDFENMIVYLTHVRYDPSEKAHYSPSQFESNILDYCNYLYDNAVAELDSKQPHIISYVHDILVLNDDRKVTYQEVYECIVNSEYEVNEYNKYYRVIKDLIDEHNRKSAKLMDENKYYDMIKMLQGQIGDLQHNVEVLLEENMELRGIGTDNKKGRWE